MEYLRYLDVSKNWPEAGRCILASHNESEICVYQAFNSEIADFALTNGFFGGGFSFTRMSWIKPNFLWMMYRSGWAEKTGQERILEITIDKSFFEIVLESAVASSFEASSGMTHEEWRLRIERSEARLQWDPDHDPQGTPLVRKAIQLGLRGNLLKRYATKEIRRIRDISSFVKEQRPQAAANNTELLVPNESIFVPSSGLARTNIGLV